MNRFSGNSDYICSPHVAEIVNVAVDLKKPLLVRGEPGTGKTLLAKAIAESLDLPLIRWQIKSTTKAEDGLYHYDAVQRLNDSRFSEGNVNDLENYIRLGPMGQAFETHCVLLIDEVDKADPEFPNDLLHELDEMNFTIKETQRTISASKRPIVVITSNAEKELPDAFLRRCVFHYIDFPEKQQMEDIVRVHHPDVEDQILERCLDRFYQIREWDELRKKPSTSELIDWIGAISSAGFDEKKLKTVLPFAGLLLKKEEDLKALRRY